MILTVHRALVLFRRAMLRAQCRADGHQPRVDPTTRVIRCARCPDWWTT